MAKSQRFTTRKEIRNAIADALRGETIVENRVFPNRTIPVGIEELPVILVYPSAEDYTVLSKIPMIHRRDLTVSIQIIASDSSEETMSDLLDQIAEEVEVAIENSDKLGGIVHDINIDTGAATLAGEGQKPEGSWVLNYNVTYIKKPKE